MIRILGCCMILGGSLGLGFWYSSQWNGRLRILRDMIHILELLGGEVRYGRAALPECCSHISRYLPEPFGEAFSAVGRRMEENTGVSFPQVFREEMEKAFAGLPLQEEDRENFLLFALQTGFSDGQMQLRAIERSAELLQCTEEKLKRENAEKSRMAVGLGAMGGLLMVIVLW